MKAHTLVLGGGAAGCVVAARLADAGCDVLLVEAGPDYRTHLPPDLSNGLRNSMSLHDWGLSHIPRRWHPPFPMPRGKVVGGSSAVNTCIALRGRAEDFDAWSSAGPEWTWPACLSAFRAIERDLDLGNTADHGSDGALPIQRHTTLHPWQAAFLEAAERLGIPAVPDMNAGDGPVGAGRLPMNLIDGHRVSAAEAWLTPARRALPNLRILAEHRVAHLRWDGTRVIGATADGPHGRITLHADRVILAAGAIHTPGILLRSGIGPAARLRTLGGEVRVDLPGVAHRLLDHPGTAIFLRPRQPLPNGPSTPALQASLRTTWHDRADLQIQPGSLVPLPGFTPRLVSIMGHLATPAGPGTLTFPSLHPDATPQIRSAFFEHPQDEAAGVALLERACALAAQPPMRRLARRVLPFFAPTPARLRRHLRWACDSGYHPCGTAPMGPSSDRFAVTNARGAVHGAPGLHIADASLFPSIPASNIHLPTLMVAWRIGGWLAEG